MKKELFILVLLTITIGIVSAIPELKVQNEAIQPGETIIGTISLSENEQFVKPISLSDIQFLQGRKQISVESDVTFFNNTYYFYACPNNEGNITLKIENILYKNIITGEIGSATLEKSFEIKTVFIIVNKTQNNITISENKTRILSVKPGFATSTKNEIIIKNVGSIGLNVTIQESSISLEQLQIQRFYLKSFISNMSPTLIVSSYKDFVIPALFDVSSASQNQTTSPSQLKLKADIEYLHINSLIGESKEEQIELFSFSDQNITDITLSSSSDWIHIENSDEITSNPLLPRQSKNLTLSFDTETQGYFAGNITISFIPKETGEKQTLVIPIYAYIFPENTPLENITVSKDSCAQMGGINCNPVTETCSTTEEYASDGFCCTSKCNPKPAANSTNTSYGWLWGVLIFVILAIAGYFIYKKFKKVRPKNITEKFTETTNIYQKRVSGSLGRN